MSGENFLPPKSQIGTDDNVSMISVPSMSVPSPISVPSSRGEVDDLIAGFGRLVQRVAHLETLLHGLLNGERPTPELPRPAGNREAIWVNPRDGDLISPAPTADVRSPAATGRTTSADRTADPHSSVIDRAWRDAPLPLRLRFVRDLLPTEHPLQPILKEAEGLEELRGRELETWLTGYPSLFADAVDRLETQPACGPGIAETLAVATLQEARQVLATTLETLGIEWIRPVAGAVIGAEHEVIGDAESPVPAGRVAGVRRRGFRQRGRLVLPAQVTRAGKREGNPQMTQINTDFHPSTPNTQHPVPHWLRVLQQRSLGCELTTVKQLLAVLRELAQTASECVAGGRSEAELAARLEPLLPLLGARHVPGLLALPAEWGDIVTETRDGLLAWLRDEVAIVVIAPEPGGRCDATTMQVTGVRRTAHAHEDGTVAKVERIGLRRGERVLFRAQVLRYEVGAGYE